MGFGVLFALLVDQQYEEFEKIYTLNQQLQLPTSLEQIENYGRTVGRKVWIASRKCPISDITHIK